MKILSIIINLIFIILIIYINILFKTKKLYINKKYLALKKDLNLDFENYKLISKIRIASYCYNLKNGGVQRITSILLNNLDRIRFFKIYLFTRINQEEGEYIISNNIK